MSIVVEVEDLAVSSQRCSLDIRVAFRWGRRKRAATLEGNPLRSLVLVDSLGLDSSPRHASGRLGERPGRLAKGPSRSASEAIDGRERNRQL